MLLVSYQFLLFLAILLLLYYILPGRLQWKLLLAASLLFYASSGFGGLLFLAAAMLTTFFLAIAMERCPKGSAVRKHILILGIVIVAGSLAVLKYTNFFLANVAALGGIPADQAPRVNWILPLGISYYTFQTLGYFIDVYRGTCAAERHLGRYALFVSFFPQMVQGPISRYDELRDQLFTPRAFEGQRIRSGAFRMLWGYFKKLVIADRIAPLALAIASQAEELPGILVWIGMFSYTIWMYADFAGGIDIVLGAAELFGIRLPENFDHPFLSGSLAEFWRRWHMSLMRWLREYIFFPMSMSKAAGRLSKKVRARFGKQAARRVPLYMASIITWFVTGIWHGASWNFVCWGMANCMVLLIAQELSGWSKRFRKAHTWTKSRGYACFEVGRTFLLFCLLEMFEYYPFSVVFRLFGRMFLEFRPGDLLRRGFVESLALLGLGKADLTVLLFAVGVFILSGFTDVKTPTKAEMRFPAWSRYAAAYLLFLAVLVFGVYGQGYNASQFIYNQF